MTNVEDAQLVAELERTRRTVADLEAAFDQQADACARSEARYGRLFDSGIFGIVICDVRGTITEANDAFLGMLGYDREELPLRWDRMTPPECRALDEAKIEEVMTTGAGAPWEKEYLARDGRRVPVLVAVALLDEARGECLAIVHDTSVRKRLEVALRALAARVGLAEERERRRIANGLHDEIGHTLALAKLRLGQLTGSDAPIDADRTIREIDELLDAAIKETRSLTFELSSPVLYELGFEAALESIGEETGLRHGFRFQFQSAQRLPRLDDDASVVLYRIVRELLNNVAKHARALSARLCVCATEDEIRITLEDDGVGFDATDAGLGVGPGGGFGLFSIKEQLRHLGCRLEIESAPDRGTRTVVVAPLASVADAAP